MPSEWPRAPAAPLSLTRCTYAQNGPTTATDPNGLRTYFIPGVGGNLYPAFTNALQGPPTYLADVRTLAAFRSVSFLNLGSELLAAAAAAADPGNDPDAQALATQVKSTLLRQPLGPGEQLNFIGYSGGATVAFDAAVVLQAVGIQNSNVATLGGFVFRGKPGNVAKWTEVVGTLDPIATRSPFADAIYQEVGVSHLPIPGTEIPSYVTGTGIPLTSNILWGAGLR